MLVQKRDWIAGASDPETARPPCANPANRPKKRRKPWKAKACVMDNVCIYAHIEEQPLNW
jgi:hypothetical protein